MYIILRRNLRRSWSRRTTTTTTSTSPLDHRCESPGIASRSPLTRRCTTATPTPPSRRESSDLTNQAGRGNEQAKMCAWRPAVARKKCSKHTSRSADLSQMPDPCGCELQNAIKIACNRALDGICEGEERPLAGREMPSATSSGSSFISVPYRFQS